MQFFHNILASLLLISSTVFFGVDCYEVEDSQLDQRSTINSLSTSTRADKLHSRDFLVARNPLDGWVVVREGHQAFQPWTAGAKPILADDLTGCFIVLIVNSNGALFAHIPPVLANAQTQWTQIAALYTQHQQQLHTPTSKVVLLVPRLAAITNPPSINNANIQTALVGHLTALGLTPRVVSYVVQGAPAGAPAGQIFANSRFTVHPPAAAGQVPAVIQINGVNKDI